MSRSGGPRSYECVRRVWHSERHQAMRGKLVQEIIRVVCEIHGAATQRNKEWQDKLPIVILKAEEILYSKAHSEEEYMDFKTIRMRLDDAIDTIIRRDKTTESETDNFLRPCIEAALVEGCVARRASRSQRYNNPVCYLSPNPHNPFQAHRINEKLSISGPFRMFPNPNASVPTPFPQKRPSSSPNIATPAKNAAHVVTVPNSHMHKDLPASHISDFHSVPSSFDHHPHTNIMKSPTVSPMPQPNILKSPTVSTVLSSFNHHRQLHIVETPVSPSSNCNMYPLYCMSKQPNNIKEKSEPKGMDLNVEPDGWEIAAQASDVTNHVFKEPPAKALDLSLRLGSRFNSVTQEMKEMKLLDMGSKKNCNDPKTFDLAASAPSGQVVSSSVPKLFMFFPAADCS